MIFRKIIDSDLVFGVIIVTFVISLAIVTAARGGKDLKVGLFGIEQIKKARTPYENPTDVDRPLFRYAPGFAILQRPFALQSEMYQPFKFVNITPSILAWYWTQILMLALSAKMLLGLIPAPSKEAGIRNLKLSFLLALPLIGYELANCQNKIMALFFMLAALLFFKENRLFLSALLFGLALTVYIPLVFFLLYFMIRRKEYIISLIPAFLIVFIAAPSFFFGFEFNNFLLREWFVRTLKPFSLAASYASYIDLRASSQSLPSAVGKLFAFGRTWQFTYLISPAALHFIIRISTGLIVLFSCLAAWKNRKKVSTGLEYAIFLILALLLPQYCIYYTWSWLFVVYFAVFNYIGRPETPGEQKAFLRVLTLILIMGSYSIAARFLNNISVLFWTTLLFWMGAVSVLMSTAKGREDLSCPAREA